MDSVTALARDALNEDRELDVLAHMSDSEGDDDDKLEALEPPVKLDESFPNCLMLCNCPKVTEKKVDRLTGVIAMYINKALAAQKIEMEVKVTLPWNNEAQTTEGFAIAVFEKAEGAEKIMQIWGGEFRLDKANMLKVLRMDEYTAIVNRHEDFVPQRTLNRIDRSDLRQWLCDMKCREQLLLRYHKDTEIYWHDTLVGTPILYYGGEREKEGSTPEKEKVWCDWQVRWSPRGSYLATWHAQGIKLWGGENPNGEAFLTQARMIMKGVKEIEFSPNEEFCMLWNGKPYDSNDDTAYAIFHVLTGQCVRRCRTPTRSPTGTDGHTSVSAGFPHFLWSNDGKWLAECTENRVVVRDSTNWKVLKDDQDKPPKNLKFECLSNFEWSPKDNIIAAWSTEYENNPARLVLVDVPSCQELASKSRTQCEATMHWQSEGDYLCLEVTKLSKTKKRISTNMEILRIRSKDIPVDVVNIEDHVRGFFWETKGHRFAVLTADEAGTKPQLQIYHLVADKCEPIARFDLPSNSYNKVIWAPEGRYFVVASVSGSGGDLLFCGLTLDNQLEILHRDEHYMLTDVQWDPSSRYVLTAVTQNHESEKGDGYRFSMELGYSIWTFQGRKLHMQPKDKLYQVSWRPHPPSLLSKAEQGDARKNMKTWSKKYDTKDEQAKESARQAFRRDREAKMSAFKSVLDRLLSCKEDKMEDLDWNTAILEFEEQQGWEEEKEIQEEELSVERVQVG